MVLEYASAFKRSLRKLSRRYRSLRDNLQPLLDQLIEGEICGDKLQGSDYNVYKVRVKNSDAQRGKSGGYRVIYYLKTQESIVLVTLYSKSDQSDVALDEVRRIIEKYEGSNEES